MDSRPVSSPFCAVQSQLQRTTQGFHYRRPISPSIRDHRCGPSPSSSEALPPTSGCLKELGIATVHTATPPWLQNAWMPPSNAPPDDLAIPRMSKNARLQQEHWRMLNEEASALRLKVAELQNARVAFRLFPLLPVQPLRPVLSKKEEEAEMERHLGPRPAHPPPEINGNSPGYRRYTSMLAQRAFRWRKLKARLMLEEEVVALRAQVFELQRQMRRIGARL
ncbi:hypothetical protein MSAN_01560500 [Mycena sanguinolenta]|uniref:Uncharacterized protein n=1 Tax=Mycena sanguinolenta TaxID=230812 RepID=A0A8H6Y408_9AGAR|nr:hypothetical protein MSAN_01560500 [Mycena sanguinolenta]